VVIRIREEKQECCHECTLEVVRNWGAGFEQGGGAHIYILLRAILEGNLFDNKPKNSIIQ